MTVVGGHIIVVGGRVVVGRCRLSRRCVRTQDTEAAGAHSPEGADHDWAACGNAAIAMCWYALEPVVVCMQKNPNPNRERLGRTVSVHRRGDYTLEGADAEVLVGVDRAWTAALSSSS